MFLQLEICDWIIATANSSMHAIVKNLNEQHGEYGNCSSLLKFMTALNPYI
jgi:hypothetical protein